MARTTMLKLVAASLVNGDVEFEGLYTSYGFGIRVLY